MGFLTWLGWCVVQLALCFLGCSLFFILGGEQALGQGYPTAIGMWTTGFFVSYFGTGLIVRLLHGAPRKRRTQ